MRSHSSLNGILYRDDEFDFVNQNVEQFYLYWLRDVNHTDISREGYVGITTTPRGRMQSHGGLLQNNKFDNYFGDIAESFNRNTILFEIIDCGSKEEILYKEMMLRCERGIGWNIAVGGYNRDTSDVVSIYGDVISDRTTSSILFGSPTTIQGRKRRFPYYDVSILASKSLKFEDRINRDFVQVNGIDYFYENLTPSFVSNVLSMDGEGYSVFEISNVLNEDRDKVYRVLKLFWREVTERVNFCFKGVWFTYVTKHSPEHCYHAVKFIDTGVMTRDVTTVYSIPKSTVEKWRKMLKDANVYQGG